MLDQVIPLFANRLFYNVVQENVQQVTDQVKRHSDDAILTTSDDDLIEDALARATFRIPTIVDEQIYAEETEVDRVVESRSYDVFNDLGPGVRRSIKQHLVVFHVPFEGNGEYFKIQPSQSMHPGPRGIVARDELIVPLPTTNRTSDQLKADFEATLSSIKQHLAILERDLAASRAQVEVFVRSFIPQRRAEILRNKNLVASLGYPMKRRPDAPTTYKAPDVKRKIAPARPPSIEAPFKPEPALDQAEYQHILSVMDNMTKVMERSPHTFAKMEEEDIRQHFLVQLNGQYEGQATGETFNAEGKTDILIRSDGRNIFIAECKIWRGEQSFVDAIDQLLGYLTWRDTKTALVIFNKNKNLTGVIAKIREVMDGHANKKRGPKDEGPMTRLRYIFGNPGDPSREITITVMVYDIPNLLSTSRRRVCPLRGRAPAGSKHVGFGDMIRNPQTPLTSEALPVAALRLPPWAAAHASLESGARQAAPPAPQPSAARQAAGPLPRPRGGRATGPQRRGRLQGPRRALESARAGATST